LAAYNAGPTTITKWSKGAGATNSAEFLKQMDYPGTKKYVGSVMKRYHFYRDQGAGFEKRAATTFQP
jgi:soluble lytic murein transglycosylase-like protein